MHSPNSAPLDITVVTPTYNRSALIVRALDSVRTQVVPPSRIIVVDDGSTDGTPDVVRRWAKEHDFPTTVDVLEKNGGPAAARNRGMELAKTEYIAFLDSDDEHLPQTLQRLVSPLIAYPDAVLSFSDATIVTPTGTEPHGLFSPRVNMDTDAKRLATTEPIHELKNPQSTLLRASIIPTSATCFRRIAALSAGLMPSEFRSGEDWLFWLRLAHQGRFVFQLDDLALHHRHDANLTHDRAAEFVTREKLRGFQALAGNTIGVALSPELQTRVAQMRDRQLQNWRYQLSLLGLRSYLNGLDSPVGRKAARISGHLASDIKSLVRAFAVSLGLR